MRPASPLQNAITSWNSGGARLLLKLPNAIHRDAFTKRPARGITIRGAVMLSHRHFVYQKNTAAMQTISQ
jgi:hypothetical protein